MPLFSFEGLSPQVHPDAWIAPTATLIGDVVVEKDASVWFGAVIRADFGRIVIREGANIQDNSVVHVNVELERVDAITANVQTVTTNVSALTGVFAATLGSPVIKVAAFSYGVRRALGERNEADVRKRVKQQMKVEKKARKARG